MIGVGYQHRTGTVFFTRNGRRLGDAYTGLRWNLFPTVGANGPCQIHVNLGQMGFVFIEANVKKWGLAPSQGTLAPPPAYGLEGDTILLATGNGSNNNEDEDDGDNDNQRGNNGDDVAINMEPPPYTSPSSQQTSSSASNTAEQS